MAGKFAKRRKVWEYSFNYTNFEKRKIAKSVFALFSFLRKNQNHFSKKKLSTTYKILYIS